MGLKTIIAIVILAFVGYRVAKLVSLLNLFKTVHNHYPGPCRLFKNIENGAEDMELLPNNKALMTSGLRIFAEGRKHLQNVKGRMFLFDFNQPELDPLEVAVEGLADMKSFNPHGLSSYVDKSTGKVTVFIVCHPADYSVINKFAFDEEHLVLRHLETIGKGDPNFRLLNDVVAISEDQFYYTNFFYYRTLTEFRLLLAWGSIALYDGTKGAIQVTGTFAANGINMSPDGRYIYVASGRGFSVYERHSDNSLTLKEEIPMDSYPDNLTVDPETGDVWAVNHPVLHKTVEHGDNPNVSAPTQVLRLSIASGHVTHVREALLDDGVFFSVGSVAIYRMNKLLVGSVSAKGMLCEVKYF